MPISLTSICLSIVYYFSLMLATETSSRLQYEMAKSKALIFSFGIMKTIAAHGLRLR